MCIRDRHTDVCELADDGDVEHSHFHLRCLYDAVSYTHLDVYKRQVQHISVEEAYAQGYELRYGKDGFMLLVPAPQDLVTGAVSYTHLDVYKRQI